MRADDTLAVYRAGYDLAEIKTTLLRDVSISVGGLIIDGKQGEVVGMPLWTARILEEGGMATAEVSDAVTELKQAIIKEQVVGDHQMATLDVRFYIRLWDQTKRLPDRDREGVEGIMVDLLRLRRGKIVQLADSSRLTGELKSRTTIEEQIFFNVIYGEGKRFMTRARGQ